MKLAKGLQNKNWIQDEIERQENRIRLKIAYIMLCIAYRKSLDIDGANRSEVFVDKKGILETVKEYETMAMDQLELFYEEKSRIIDLCQKLKVPQNLYEESSDTSYKRVLEELENELTEKIKAKTYESEDATHYYSIMKLLEMLYNNLGKLNFNPNQSKKYIERYFADIIYFPRVETSSRKTYLPPNTVYSTNGDEIIIFQTGEVGFRTYRQPSGKTTYDDLQALKEYKIIKRYKDPKVRNYRKKLAETGEIASKWDEAEDGEVFWVYGNINTEVDDIEYKRYNNDVLLSTSNLEAAVNHNGGYIGEVCYNYDTNEYVVIYNQEKLCLTIDFQNIKNSRRKEGKTIIGTSYTVQVDVKKEGER